MKTIQKQVDDWAQTLETPYWQPLEIVARLVEEVGEVARAVNIEFGAKKQKPGEDLQDIENELGDVIFTLACIANSLDLDLERGFQHSMKKCTGRDKDLHVKK